MPVSFSKSLPSLASPSDGAHCDHQIVIDLPAPPAPPAPAPDEPDAPGEDSDFPQLVSAAIEAHRSTHRASRLIMERDLPEEFGYTNARPANVAAPITLARAMGVKPVWSGRPRGRRDR